MLPREGRKSSLGIVFGAVGLQLVFPFGTIDRVIRRDTAHHSISPCSLEILHQAQLFFFFYVTIELLAHK